MIGPESFVFLNAPGGLDGKNGWNDPEKEQLWLYNLHYFDDLQASGLEDRLEWHRSLIDRWIADNPPALGNGWLPYPLSLRIVNWIKWHLGTSELNQSALDSLYTQADHLYHNCEDYLLGNHLFVNAKALIFAGLLFGVEDSAKPKIWLEKGLDYLAREIEEQVFADGANFEQTPMYHAIFLEDVLDIINASRAWNADLPCDLETVAARMLGFLEKACHPDGEISFFNDSAMGVAKTLANLAAYAQRLGINPIVEARKVSVDAVTLLHFEDSGFVRVDADRYCLMVDAGRIGPDYVPSHAHADTLSFEMSVAGERFLVNSGTSQYRNGPARDWQRSTMAHNTVVVDGRNQTEVWSSFRVARRAYPQDVRTWADGHSIHFIGGHDGYRRFKNCKDHVRHLVAVEAGIEVIDMVQGHGIHSATACWHLHPAWIPSKIGNSNFMFSHAATGMKVTASFFDGDCSIEKTHWYPEFGVSCDNFTLKVEQRGHLPIKLRARFEIPAR